jgi:hypothetical protein
MRPEYEKFVVYENGVKVLYVLLLKAMYGCVKSALLWYQLFSGTLVDMGFELNPYEPCMANCMIQGKQCTIAWYVDDNKISHVEPGVVTMVISKIDSVFDKMTVTRGRDHNLLGMQVHFSDDNKAIINMKTYIIEAIQESLLGIDREATTPAKKNLFDVSATSDRLVGTRADVFHSVVAKLLYVATRARVDILLVVSFLCSRVSSITVEDESKLRRLLEYLKGTTDLDYVLAADDLTKMQ